MEKIELEATKRSIKGKKNRALRAAGKIPAVLYGRGVKSEALQLESKLIERAYRQAGGNKIVALKVGEGRPRNVLIHDVQHDGTRGDLMHVDFYAVRMDEALRTAVPIHFVGESTAVYQNEGTLVKNAESVQVECLPADLPEFLEADISVLEDFDKTLTLADVKVPAGVKIVDELDTLIAKVEPPRSEEELEELDEAVTEELPEGAEEEEPVVVAEENEGDKDRRDKK